jgi:two-component sensor histidine kinase
VGRDRGTINIHLTTVGNESVRLLFRDDGWGLPDGLDLQAAESLGLRLIRMLSKQLRGEVITQTGEGTTFELRFQIPDQRGVGASSESKAVLDAQGEHTHR